METTLNHQASAGHSKISLWAGRVISGICILFLLFDAITKIMKVTEVISTCTALGLPEYTIRPIGVLLLICTIVYSIPRTAIIGAILLSGFLGGAIAIMLRAGQPLYFATVFAILVWVGLYLRNDKVRNFLF